MAVKGFFFNALKFHKLPIRLKPRMTDFTLCAYINETAVPRKIVSNREGEGAASHV